MQNIGFATWIVCAVVSFALTLAYLNERNRVRLLGVSALPVLRQLSGILGGRLTAFSAALRATPHRRDFLEAAR